MHYALRLFGYDNYFCNVYCCDNLQPSYPLYSELNYLMRPTTIDLRVVKEINEATLEFKEDETTYEKSLRNTSETKNDDGYQMTPQMVQVDRDGRESIEELKSEMKFNSLNDLNYYYKRYAK